MDIHLVLFVTSAKRVGSRSEMLMKTVYSSFRPVMGDHIDDPGFDANFHNGYEVVKVAINYEDEMCYVSLSPLAIEVEDMPVERYIDKLLANGWEIVEKEHYSS